MSPPLRTGLLIRRVLSRLQQKCFSVSSVLRGLRPGVGEEQALPPHHAIARHDVLTLDLDAQSNADLGTLAGALGEYRALRIREGSPFVLGRARLEKDSVLYLHAGKQRAEADSLRVMVLGRPALQGDLQPKFEIFLTGATAESKSLIELLDCEGDYEFLIEVHGSGEALIVDAAVGNKEALPRALAATNYRSRLASELAHFSGSAYTHPMYGPSIEGEAKRTGIAYFHQKTVAAPAIDFAEDQRSDAMEHLALMHPIEGETAYNFSMRCLGMLLPINPPDFFQRISALSETRPIRVLSLCAGAARIEEMLLKHCVSPSELYLFDASEELIDRAAGRMRQDKHRVHCVLGDVNEGLPVDGPFDVIMCVSALHHVVELERLFRQINEQLASGGEFWSIGEQIGRNGNRLWPTTRALAERSFSKLPTKYRRNAHTGRTDTTLPDRDFSIGCFEGVRSEEIESMLEQYLVPVEVYKRNCFLWRLVDATYADNYDLSDLDDVEVLRQLIADEVMHWTSGGRPTELHGVYRRREVVRRDAVAAEA
jgi:SAM-dependent methyltransferase